MQTADLGEMCGDHVKIQSLFGISLRLIQQPQGVVCIWQVWCFPDDSQQESDGFGMPAKVPASAFQAFLLCIHLNKQMRAHAEQDSALALAA